MFGAPASPCVDSADPKMYLQCPAVVLDFAICPHVGRHRHAGAPKCDTKARAWAWVVQQVRECMAGHTSERAELINKPGLSCPETLQRMRQRLYPFYIAAAATSEISKCGEPLASDVLP